jgi:hypothetical protein
MKGYKDSGAGWRRNFCILEDRNIAGKNPRKNMEITVITCIPIKKVGIYSKPVAKRPVLCI